MKTRVLHKQRLATRLMALILGFSALVTLMATAIQTKIAYDREIANIRSNFQQVLDTSAAAMSENVWLLDNERLSLLLEGLARNPDFQYAAIFDHRGVLLMDVGTSSQSSDLLVQRKLSYTHRGETRDIGTFVLVAHSNEAEARVTNNGLYLLAINGFLIFIVAVVIYVTVHRMITRHMEDMARYARNFSTASLNTPLVIRRQATDDELSDLEQAVNAMRISLRDSYAEMQTLNRDLEGRVAERTADLTTEIIERKSTEDALRESLGLNEAMFSVSPVGMALYDETGQCIAANQALADIVGAQPHQLLAQNFHEVKFWEESGLLDVATKAIAENRTLRQEVNMLTTFGLNVALDCHMSPFRSRGKTHLMYMATDMTNRNALQAQLIQTSKLATLGEMATGMAHELNQPLNVISMSTANILRKSKKSPIEADYLNEKLHRIASQVERAASIIDHMRVFGRKSDKTPDIIDLRRVVSSSIDLIGEQLKTANVTLSSASPDSPVLVKGFQVQLEQVLLNLLSNTRDVIRATGLSGHVDIHLSQHDNLATLTIQDNGGGIPAEAIDRIFEPFFTTKGVGEGTGLGLSISYGIIKDMQGDITVANVDDGACFTIQLPLEDCA